MRFLAHNLNERIGREVSKFRKEFALTVPSLCLKSNRCKKSQRERYISYHGFACIFHVLCVVSQVAGWLMSNDDSDTVYHHCPFCKKIHFHFLSTSKHPSMPIFLCIKPE